MKRDHKIKKNWRQLEIAFPVHIAPPTFASPKAAYDFFVKHEDELPDVDHSEPEDSDLDGAVSEFGQDSLDLLSGIMSLPVVPAASEDVPDSQDVESETKPETNPENSDNQ